jgi:Fe-S-cluster containining protein
MNGPQPPPAPGIRPVQVQLTVGGRQLNLRVDAPTGPVAPAALLPLYRGLAEKLTAVAIEEAARAGDHVTCRRGCAACCRQVVAVSALEARELMKVVERLPEPLRTRVKDRFAAARSRLQNEAPDLLPKLLNPQDFDQMDGAARDDLARRYFRLQIDCPFLEDEACVAYDERPITCRQYVAVSPPEHCSTLSPQLRTIAPSGGAAYGWAPVAERSPATDRPVEFLALVMAPDFVAAHPDEPPARPGVELLNEFFQRMQTRGSWGKPTATK